MQMGLLRELVIHLEGLCGSGLRGPPLLNGGEPKPWRIGETTDEKACEGMGLLG